MAVNFENAIECGTEEGIEWALMNAPRYGAINGYAKLPEGHPWHELDLQWDDSEVVDVHGGITYGPKDGWIGFDTLHAWDIWPGKSLMFASDAHDPMNIYWTQDMVREEAQSLARKVSEAMK